MYLCREGLLLQYFVVDRSCIERQRCPVILMISSESSIDFEESGDEVEVHNVTSRSDITCYFGRAMIGTNLRANCAYFESKKKAF